MAEKTTHRMVRKKVGDAGSSGAQLRFAAWTLARQKQEGKRGPEPRWMKTLRAAGGTSGRDAGAPEGGGAQKRRRSADFAGGDVSTGAAPTRPAAEPPAANPGASGGTRGGGAFGEGRGGGSFRGSRGGGAFGGGRGDGSFGGSGVPAESGLLGPLKRLGAQGVEAVKDLAHDFGDKDESYIDKFSRGDIGGGLANAVGTAFQSPQSLYLNALSGIQDAAAGKRPEFQYRMDALDYMKQAEVRAGTEGEGLYSKLADMLNSERLSKRLLGNALALGANLGTDPLSYLDGAAVLKGRWGRTPGTPAYGEAVSSGREAARLAEEARLIDEGWRDDEQPGMEKTDKGVVDDPEYDDIINRSVGAKRSSGSVLDPKTGRYYQLENYLQDQEAFAGYGVSTSLHEGVAEGLTEQFGGEVGRWQHAKGFTRLDMDGEEVMAETHWFQEPSVGKVKLVIKEWWFE